MRPTRNGPVDVEAPIEAPKHSRQKASNRKPSNRKRKMNSKCAKLDAIYDKLKLDNEIRVL